MRQKLIEGVQDYSAMNATTHNDTGTTLRDRAGLRRKSIPMMLHNFDLSGRQFFLIHFGPVTNPNIKTAGETKAPPFPSREILFLRGRIRRTEASSPDKN
jgi:hypothetical protein